MDGASPPDQRCLILELLPAEIREIIWTYTLRSQKCLVAYRLLDDYQREDYQEVVQPPLTRTCRQIRAEGLPVFYGINEVVVKAGPSDVTHAWLQGIRAYLPMLKHVSILVPYLSANARRYNASGALRLSLVRSKTNKEFLVSDDWAWATVTRPPAQVKYLAQWLTDWLKWLLFCQKAGMDDPDGFYDIVRYLWHYYQSEEGPPLRPD